MASNLPPSDDVFVRREGLRIVGAVAALLAAALVIAGGLLWREHARGQPNAHVRPSSVSAPR